MSDNCRRGSQTLLHLARSPSSKKRNHKAQHQVSHSNMSTKQKNRLRLLYNLQAPYLWGYVVRTDGSGAQTTSSPFVISQSFNDEKVIVYGCLGSILQKMESAIAAMEQCGEELANELRDRKLNTDNRANAAGQIKVLLPDSPEATQLFFDYLIKIENGLLLLAVYSRILFEMLPALGKSKIPVYDYDLNRIGDETLKSIGDLMCHQRYLFIDGEIIRDLFSDKKSLSKGLMGAAIKWREYRDAIKQLIYGITIRDLTRVLSKWFGGSPDSLSDDKILSLVQNMHYLTNLLADKISDPRYRNLLDMLFDDKFNELSKYHRRESGRITETVHFQRPHFQIRGELEEKEIEISVKASFQLEDSPNTSQPLQVHRIYVKYIEFFRQINEQFGTDPLISESIFSGRQKTRHLSSL